jgi:hypothetical protein
MKKEGILIGAAVALTLLTTAYEAASIMPAAPERAEPASLIIGKQAAEAPQTPAIAGSDPLAIREAHSDGGYWYWEASQPARARVELAAKP